MSRFLTSILLVAAFVAAVTATFTSAPCNGTARYRLTFQNFLTPAIFGSLIPESGLVFSPLAAVSHSNRISFLTVRGFATPAVEEIAETGSNAQFLELATTFQSQGRGVKSIEGADGPTMPGNFTSLEVDVDCAQSYVTMLGMIAPSPDWIVQFSNINLFDRRFGDFIMFRWGFLIAYDAGTDSGREFTDPADPSLDEPTEPRLNIAPRVEDETDRFEGRIVGKYAIQRI